MHPCKVNADRQDVSWKRLKQKNSTEGRRVAKETTAKAEGIIVGPPKNGGTNKARSLTEAVLPRERSE